MAVDKPVAVPEQNVTSVDVVGFGGGLNLNGPQNAPINAFVDSKDVELSIDGFLQPRRKLIPFLPDTVDSVFQILPAVWNNTIYYFTADNGKVVYCQEGDTSWTTCGGTNTISTGNGGKTSFLRVLDNILILNGTNGDKLAYVNMSGTGFPIVKYTHVTDSSAALTSSLTNLTTGSFSIYYAFSYTGNVGETVLSPILTQSINIVRDQWGISTSAPSSITLTRPGTAPAGANYWNLYVALAATAGTIQPTDMLLLAAKIDLNTTKFTDNGTLDINLGSVAPTANSTDGPRVNHGIVENGNPILFDDVDDPENIWIGGGGPYAMDFSISNGGYKAQTEKGTNFRPTAVLGFRNGVGTPSITVLFSNTEGLSKQSVLEQDTVNYGNQSFTVWGVKEQHYGAAGVAATDSTINYNGKLLFLSTDGFMQMNTQPLRQNVIATDPISIKNIDSYVRKIKSSAMKKVVGAGWDNKYMWTIPNDGFDDPQQILIQDENNNGAWYTLNIPAQWIGVVTPEDAPAFVYICQGNKSYKLAASTGTFDTINGVSVPFSTKATGPLISMGGPAHNHWQADVQAMFNFTHLIGDVTVGVTYRGQGGQYYTNTVDYSGPSYVPSGAGGWSDGQWTYGGFPAISSWAGSAQVLGNAVSPAAEDVRIPVPIDDIMNDAQWFYSTPVGFNDYQFHSVSFEGINLGVRPDLQ